MIQQLWRSLKKLGIKPPYDPAISLLGIYPEKTIMQKDTCTPVFTATLFIIVQAWKQPKCPLRGKDVVHMYSGILLSHKRNKIGSFVLMWMDLESVIQSEKEKKNIIH